MNQEPSANRDKFFTGIKETDASVEDIAAELVDWLENHGLWNIKYTNSGYISVFSPNGTEIFYIAPNAGNFHSKPFIELRHFSRKELLETILLEKLLPEMPDFAEYGKKMKNTKRKVCAPWMSCNG